MSDKGIVIVGASHGGVQLAASLREKGYDGPLTMLTNESDLPYQKPPLSKGYIKDPDPKPTLLRPEKFYTDRNIDLRLGAEAVAIDRSGGAVRLADGNEIACSKIALAIGSRPRRIPIPNIDAPGVLELRTYLDSQIIKAGFDAAGSVLVIGGGFIGLEIAATAAQLGKRVVVLEAEARLMARAVSPAVSAYFFGYLTSLGADIRLNARVSAIRVDGGKAAGADLADGTVIDADCVISGTGVVPCSEMAEAAGLAVENGIAVGPTMLTSVPEIAAIGDCASYVHWQIDRRVRLESVQNAVDQAKVAAAALLDANPAPYREVPWFWSDQGEAKLQMAGLPGGGEEVVLRGDPESGSFSAFLFAGDVLRSVESVNKAGDHALARRILAAGIKVTPAQVADPDCDLRALVKQARS